MHRLTAATVCVGLAGIGRPDVVSLVSIAYLKGRLDEYVFASLDMCSIDSQMNRLLHIMDS